jgi:NADH dehydrogenase [ubiquinone] 1 alpha subcomplex assembly factor 7
VAHRTGLSYDTTVSTLTIRIADEIAERGPITVARFMEMALTEPGLGYYMTRDPFGAGGDFTTAPEISQMFGELIGLWSTVTWEAMGRPAPFILAELGPGRGTLMADALRAARARPGFEEATRLHLVEASPALRARQQAALASDRPSWHAGFADLPPGPMILLANEFFDALPVRQFVRVGGAWHERRVTHAAARGDDPAGGTFRFAIDDEAMVHDDLPAAADGTIAEVCESGIALAAAIGARVAAQGGAALVIDYGHTGGVGETLQALRNKDYADPLSEPGAADITAHVDFAALARAARGSGATCFGPVSQGWFLSSLGIVQRAERLTRNGDTGARADIEAALKRLIAPSEMGNLFKVLAITDPRLGTPAGFAARAL